MSKVYNRARVATATTGTGTMTLGAATTSAYFTFSEAGVADADEVTYLIEDGTDVEIGRGVYTSAGTTLTRATVLRSKIAGVQGTSKINLSGSATVSIVAVAEDLPTSLAALSVWGVTGNAVATPAAIAAGSDGHVLRRSGTTLAFGTVANAGIRDSAGLSVLGRSANSTGSIADITAGTDGHVLRRSGTTLGFGSLAGSQASLVLIQTQTASSSAQIDFTTGLDDTYDAFVFHLSNVIPATDDVELWIRAGTGAGPTYQTANYRWAVGMTSNGGSAIHAGSAAGSSIVLTSNAASDSIGNAAGEAGWDGVVRFSNPDGSVYKMFSFNGAYTRADGSIIPVAGAGAYVGATSAITGVRFMMETGNIASGRISLYGVRKS